MKKRSLIGPLAATLVIALLIAGLIRGKGYYEDRYVGRNYYTMVPPDYDLRPESMYSSDGKVVGLGKEFNLTAYDELGVPKEVSFPVYGDDSAGYPQPGSFLLVSASKQIVVEWSVIAEEEVPEAARSMIRP